MAVRLDLEDQLDEPDGLHGLAERGRRLVRHARRDAAHLAEFGATRLVRRLLGELRCKMAVALRKVFHGVDDDLYSLIKDVLVDGIGIREIERCSRGLRARFVTFEAFFEDAFVVDGEMRIAGVQLALHTEDARLHEDADLVRQQHAAAVAERVVLPERRDAPQLFFRFFCNIEDIAVALLEQVELIHDEFHRVLWEDRRVAVLRRLVAAEERLVLNVDRHVAEDRLEHAGAQQHARQVAVLLVHPRRDDGALRVDVRFLVEYFLAEGLHARRQSSEMLCVFHDSSSFRAGKILRS